MIRQLSLIVFVSLLLLCVADGFAQHQYDVWHFGNGAFIDFHTNPPVVSANGGPTRTFEGSGMYCDTAGIPIITCDGLNIYDRTGGVMFNGSGILGGDSTSAQAATIVPWPCSPNKFIVINTDLYGYGNRPWLGSHYSIVDMKLNGGLGAVIAKNVALNSQTDEHCAVVHFGAGPDYWAILHNGANNTFYAYRISSSGISQTPVISKAGKNSELGYLKASSDGRKLAMTGYFGLTVDLFDFNPFTGVVSNPIDLFTNIRRIYQSQAPYGVCFSPDNTKLYFSVETDRQPENTRVYQANLSAGSAANIINSVNCVTDTLTPVSPDKVHYGMELGPDGKIYISTSGVGISTIENPNLFGNACNFVDSKYILNSIVKPYQNAGVPSNIEGKAKLLGIDTANFVLKTADTLFFRDTVALCASKTRTFTFNTLTCDSIPILSRRIIGFGSSEYSIDDTSATRVAGEATVSITFAPTAKGLQDAFYELVIVGNDTIRVLLRGVGGDTTYNITAKKEVNNFGDSAALCTTIKQQYTINSNGCEVPNVVSQTITGLASTEYAIVTAAPKILSGDDQVAISFSPKYIGNRNAQYELQLADGKIITIPLNSKGVNARVTLTLSNPVVFPKDSLALCDSLERKITLTKSQCSNLKIVSQTLSGVNATDYRITKPFADSLLDNNELRIRFHPSALGLRDAVYTVLLSDGETITIPLKGSGVNFKNSIIVSDDRMFVGDTLASCDSLELTIDLAIRGCGTLRVVSQSLGGAFPGDYSVVSKPQDSLLSDNILRLRFHPNGFGNRNATYTIIYDDGRSSVISLEGIGINAASTLAVSPTTLFATDSLILCDSLEVSVDLSKFGCGILRVVSQSLSGNTPGDYTIVSKLSDSVEANNRLKIRFHPSAFGKRDAIFLVTFDDNQSIIIPLLGTGINGATIVTQSVASLFDLDSLSLCDTVVSGVQIDLRGCGILHVVSQSIIGTSANDYTISLPIRDSVETSNSINIRFHPSAFGKRDAAYHLVFDDGRTLDIPLRGSGTMPKQLTLQSQPTFSTMVIGGDIRVPITINGLDRQLPIEMTVHFDRNLAYRGSYSIAGTTLDIPGTTTTTTSRILIPQSEIVLGGITAYADFDVYVDTERQSVVTIDSLVVASVSASCLYMAQTSSTTTVTGPVGCGISLISDFMRYRKTPIIQTYPNPSTGTVTITSSQNIGEVSINICDAVGSVRHIETATLSPLHPATVTLAELPSGVYFIRLKNDGYVFVLRHIILK